MILIGYLSHRKNPRTVKQAYYFAVAAQKENAEFLFFSPKGIDIANRKINGYILVKNQWKKVERRFPDVIFNHGNPGKMAHSQDKIDVLKQEIPFTSHSIGSKMTVYYRLKEAKTFSEYLIPSITVYSPKDVLNALNKYKKIVFKPNDGHKGIGVTFIDKLPKGYSVKVDHQKFIYNEAQLMRFVKQRIRGKKHLIQPYINSKTRYGVPFDLRLHVQKDGNGEWKVALIYARVARNNSFVTNLSSGGSRVPIEKFLRQQYPKEYSAMKKRLERFALDLARHMDEIQQQVHSETLDELGIDIGIDQNKHFWIYEVNWRPGLPHALFGKVGAERTMIQYTIYLAKQHKSHLNNR